jgi:FkbM family methyltransferase
VVAGARPSARILAIEPDPLIRERLQVNLALSRFGNVTISSDAVGEAEGEAGFVRDTGNLGESHVDADGALRVKMRPLAATLSEAGIAQMDALKIDIEGYEDRALIPFFREWPAQGRPRAIVIEHVHPGQWRSDVMAVLAGLGYQSQGVTEYNTLLRLA